MLLDDTRYFDVISVRQAFHKDFTRKTIFSELILVQAQFFHTGTSFDNKNCQE